LRMRASGTAELCLLAGMVLLVSLFSGLVVSVTAVSSQDAATSVSEAEQSLAQAYIAVLDAERAGANVSSLLVRLNEGADLLSESQLALEDGNSVEASRLATLLSSVAGDVWDEAARLKVEAGDAAVNRSWFYLVVSVVVVSVVLVASGLGYRYFKGWYFRRLLKLKPKVGKE
jgi:hypothetical protein